MYIYNGHVRMAKLISFDITAPHSKWNSACTSRFPRRGLRYIRSVSKERILNVWRLTLFFWVVQDWKKSSKTLFIVRLLFWKKRKHCTSYVYRCVIFKIHVTVKWLEISVDKNVGSWYLGIKDMQWTIWKQIYIPWLGKWVQWSINT